MKRAVLVTAALAAAVAVWWSSLPPGQIQLAQEWSDGTVRGVLHVHSRVSDGRGTPEMIAAAADRAGLQFVVLTDHGDGTRPKEPPVYLSGVLMLDGVEISTRGGHYVAIGLPRAPYPLGGEARDVVDDVRRMGGFGIAAHPDSPRDELRWADWSLPFDGFELINPDTSWRIHAFADGLRSRALLVRSLLGYPARPAESIAQILTDTSALRDKWLDVAQYRRVTAVAGADAHAKLALRNREPGDNSYSIPLPNYDASFSAVSVHVALDEPLSGEAARDAVTLLEAIRRGSLYVAVDGWASPPAFQLSAASARGAVREGGTLESGSPVTLRIRSNAPSGYHTLVWRGRERIADRPEQQFELSVGEAPGVYVVEVRRGAPDGPAWITSNPIYVRRTPDSAPSDISTTPPVPTGASQALFDGRTTAGWSPEAHATSLADVRVATLVTGGRILLRYGLAGGSLAGQYAAAAVETPAGVDGFDGIAFSARGDGPMRVSVQVRADVAGAPPERWQRSVFVDASEQQRFVRFADMTPVGATHSERPPARAVRTIMFVVDTTNTKPGASGQLWIGAPRLTRE